MLPYNCKKSKPYPACGGGNTMDRHSYGTERWSIICGSLEGTAGNAVKLLYAGMSQEVPYILTARRAGEGPELTGVSLAVIGTPADNALLASLPQAAEIPEEGYLVQVTASPFDPGRQMAVLAGSSPAQALYAAAHFLNEYLPNARQNSEHHPYFLPLFSREMPEYRAVRRPAFAERGIWTWGHCIYDYQRFARNMAGLGLNAVTIWNDFAPLNLREVVDCFHSYGIRVYFGYSWGWDEEIDISSEREFQRVLDTALSTYENSYAGAGGDGVYFQSFTETEEETLNGLPIAETVVDWVNRVGGAMLERWPGLDIRFGLHATSVKNRMDAIAGVDPRISIHWEDCGAFPYAYFSRAAEGEAETLAFTDRMAALRPSGEYGVVLKGQVCLDWTMFENQKGPFLLGCESDGTIRARRERIAPQWHDVQGYWLKNLGQFRRTLAHLPGAAVYALVEDALLEDACWYPVALYAAALWETGQTDGELLCTVARRPDTVLA